jgi:hypothetical protein
MTRPALCICVSNDHAVYMTTGKLYLLKGKYRKRSRVFSCRLKGTVSRDFLLLVFSWISFPQAPDYTIRAVLNLFEDLRRYLQLKVSLWCRWHWWQMEKIFNQKTCYDFFWIPLGSRVSMKINFFFKFILRCQQFDNCSHWLPPASLTPVANLPLVSTTLAKLHSTNIGHAPWIGWSRKWFFLLTRNS